MSALISLVPTPTGVEWFETVPIKYPFVFEGQVWRKDSLTTAILDTGKNPEPRLFKTGTKVVPCHALITTR